MQVRIIPATQRVERPTFVWIGFIAAILTGLGAIPVGLQLIADSSGASIGLPSAWIESTPFGSYLVPGLYLLLMNGIGMLVLAGLIVRSHWSAPWVMAVLGVGLIIWILVQLALLPETSFLQWLFLITGFLLGCVALFWLRRTGQLRLW
jgi:uncharacterized protein with PQ loop repeat